MNREDNQLITKSNVLIQQSIDELEKRELYLMAVILSEFKALNADARCLTDVKNKTVTLNVTEFLNYLDLDIDSGSNQEECKKIITHFQGRAFFTWVDDKYANRTPMFENIQIPKHWIDETIEKPNRVYDINFTLNDRFIDYIAVREEYTTLFRKSILSLKSAPSIKLYQLLKSYGNKDFDTTITVSELRLKLGLTSKAYDRFGNFYARGIEKPLEDINKHTEINVTVKKNQGKKDKRIVESLTFHIKNAEKKHKGWDYSFPDVSLNASEYEEIKQWITPIHWKTVCADLQKQLDEGKDIRNHYKWIAGHYRELLKKYETRLAAQPTSASSDEADDYYRSLFQNRF